MYSAESFRGLATGEGTPSPSSPTGAIQRKCSASEGSPGPLMWLLSGAPVSQWLSYRTAHPELSHGPRDLKSTLMSIDHGAYKGRWRFGAAPSTTGARKRTWTDRKANHTLAAHAVKQPSLVPRPPISPPSATWRPTCARPSPRRRFASHAASESCALHQL